jgi:uncharacterized membrane protein
MSYASQLLDSYPRTFNLDARMLAATIDALTDCAQACTADADNDMSEPDVADLVKCMRLCMDCASICMTTCEVISRQTESDPGVTRPMLEACMASCKSCGDECERMAMKHAHCQVCAQACRRCEQACRQLLDAMMMMM